MNCKKKPFDDVRVRQAMNYACPQEEIVKSVFRNFAQPARSNIARVCPEYTSEFWKYNYNPDRAAKLLADAGYPQGFEIELDFSDQEPFSEETCVIMRGALNKIKVECKLRKIPGAAFMERLFKRDFVFAANTQAPLVPDAAYWASLFYKSGVFLNFLELNDPELDKMIDTVRLIYELKKRQEMAKKIQERILDLAPRVFICSVNTNVAMRDDVGGTFHASWVPTTYYWDKLDKA
jgi:peptide/nickel transport system substrate-binding protein